MSPRYDFGSLSIEQACEGARICIANARRMVEQSKFLIEHSLPELAILAVCTAIEEAGKAFLLLGFSSATSQGKNDANERLADAFCNHSPKYRTALEECEYFNRMLQLVIQAVNSEGLSPEAASGQFLTNIRSMKAPQATPHVNYIFETRNEMLYTVYKDGVFSPPEGKGRKSQWNELMRLAEDSVHNAEAILKMSLFAIKSGRKIEPKLSREEGIKALIEGMKKEGFIIVKSESKIKGN